MIHRPNRYEALCAYCKQLVPKMSGWLRQRVASTSSTDNFIVVCKGCFEQHRAELHPKHCVPFSGKWDAEKSPRKHLFNRGVR